MNQYTDVRHEHDSLYDYSSSYYSEVFKPKVSSIYVRLPTEERCEEELGQIRQGTERTSLNMYQIQWRGIGNGIM